MYLMKTPIRHSLLVKHKTFKDKKQAKIRSTSNKLLGIDGKKTAIDVEAFEEVPNIRVEDSDDDTLILKNIPPAPEKGRQNTNNKTKCEKETIQSPKEDEGEDEHVGEPQIVDSCDDEDDNANIAEEKPKMHRRGPHRTSSEADKKKKMEIDISYEGFSIYGRVLCLVVKRRETGAAGEQGKGYDDRRPYHGRGLDLFNSVTSR